MQLRPRGRGGPPLRTGGQSTTNTWSGRGRPDGNDAQHGSTGPQDPVCAYNPQPALGQVERDVALREGRLRQGQTSGSHPSVSSPLDERDASYVPIGGELASCADFPMLNTPNNNRSAARSWATIASAPSRALAQDSTSRPSTAPPLVGSERARPSAPADEQPRAEATTTPSINPSCQSDGANRDASRAVHPSVNPAEPALGYHGMPLDPRARSRMPADDLDRARARPGQPLPAGDTFYRAHSDRYSASYAPSSRREHDPVLSGSDARAPNRDHEPEHDFPFARSTRTRAPTEFSERPREEYMGYGYDSHLHGGYDHYHTDVYRFDGVPPHAPRYDARPPAFDSYDARARSSYYPSYHHGPPHAEYYDDYDRRPTSSSYGYDERGVHHPHAHAPPVDFHHHRAPVHELDSKIRDLSASEVKSFSTTMEPVMVDRWQLLFKLRLANRHPLLRAVLDHNIDTIGAAVRASAPLNSANHWLAETIMLCLVETSPHVQHFYMKLEERPSLLRSGVDLLHAIVTSKNHKLGVEMTAAKHDFDQAVFFRQGMSKSEVQEAGVRLVTQFRLLATCKTELDVLKAIVSKLPACMSKRREELHNDLLESEEGISSKRRLTRDELFALAAVHLRVGATSETLSVEQPSPPPALDERLEALLAREERRGRDSKNDDICHNCGTKGCHFKSCKKKCSKCELPFCPGTAKGPSACAVHSTTPVDIKKLKNARGDKMLRTLALKIQREQEKFSKTTLSVEKDADSDVGAPESDEDNAESERSVSFYTGSTSRRTRASAPVVVHDDGSLTVRFQLDGGSNACLLNLAPELLASVGNIVPTTYSVSGISGHLIIAQQIECLASALTSDTVTSRAGDPTLFKFTAGICNAKFSILAESTLAALGISVHKIKLVMEWSNGTTVPIMRENGLYYVDIALLPHADTTTESAIQIGPSLSICNSCELDSCAPLLSATNTVVLASTCARAIVLQTAARRYLARRSLSKRRQLACKWPATSCSLEIDCSLEVNQANVQPGHGSLRMQIDGGSNATIVNAESARSVGKFTPTTRSIIGISTTTSVLITESIDVNAKLVDGKQLAIRDACYTTDARRSILAESWLADKYGIDVLKTRKVMLWPDGSETPILRENGLYYIDVHLLAPSPLPNVNVTLTTCAAQISASDKALLWAARMGIDSARLLKFSRCVQGVNIENISKSAAEIIDHDRFRRLAASKKRPTPATPAKVKAAEPGHTFIIDGFGPHAAHSPVNGAIYQFHSVCENTSYGYTATSILHTAEEWFLFIQFYVLDARSHGHKAVRSRADCGPDVHADKLQKRCRDQLNHILDYTPRRHHEGVGAIEINNDVLTRMAEADMQRAGRGTAWLLEARGYAQARLNFLPVNGGSISRRQAYLKKVPIIDVDRPLLIFWTTVLVNEEKVARGPKGSLDKPRAFEGNVIGTGGFGSHYRVIRRSNGALVTPRHVDPLDELQLMRRGIPSGGASIDAQTQTPPDSELLTPLPPPPRPASPLVKKVDLPIGSRIAVEWIAAKGNTKREYKGTIVALVEKDDGSRIWRVQYDGSDDIFNHNFDTTKRTWRLLKPDAAPRRSTRLLQATLAILDRACEESTATHVAEKFNATSSCLFGEEADMFVCTCADEVSQQRADLERHLLGVSSSTLEASVGMLVLETNKASQNVVDVQTPIGLMQMQVPATLAELKRSPQKEEWMIAERKGLDDILLAGNRLVKKAAVVASGKPIARAVSQRRIKKDQSTGRLETKNAFKVRHCVDGGFLKVQERRYAQTTGTSLASEVNITSTCIDDLGIKMMCSQAAAEDANLCKADIGSAYPKGDRRRPIGYMALPTSLADMRDEDGEELVIELSTPICGEKNQLVLSGR